MPDDTGNEPTYYEVLGLATSASTTKQDVKAAYHRALLQYHPDKLTSNGSLNQSTHRSEHKIAALYTVDQITAAYHTLSNPVTRVAYDKQLQLSSAGSSERYDRQAFHEGLEIHDLEDMNCDEAQSIWYRGCRCGDEEGYTVTEAELERESSEGQIFVACKGCSLWIKILFSVTGSDIADEKSNRNDS